MSSKNDGRGARPTFTDQEALLFHSQGRPGKLEVVATKPMATQRDLSLAYSPGVAIPVLAIADDPAKAYDYTDKGNFVAVITNGTAILGLGNRGALAAKPVMEGKSVLFKRFADVDSIDLEVATEDPREFIDCVKFLSKSWGGINLEDIKAPECFIIEQRLRELLDIPVFHDDQHGTAIIAAAGLINALDLDEFKTLNARPDHLAVSIAAESFARRDEPRSVACANWQEKGIVVVTNSGEAEEINHLTGVFERLDIRDQPDQRLRVNRAKRPLGCLDGKADLLQILSFEGHYH